MEKKKVVVEDSSSHTLLTILLVVSIVMNALSLYFLMGNSVSIPWSGSTQGSTGGTVASIDPIGIKKAILEIEYDKVWGKENYDLVNKAQQLQLKQTLPQIKQFVETNGGSAAGAQGTPAQPNTSSTLTPDVVSKVISDAVVEGNKNADIIAIEYSDMECPFCIRQYHDTKLWESLQAKYGDKVKFAFKSNRGVNHPGTELKALGALCAQKIGGDTAYVKFYNTVMSGSTTSSVYSVARLPDAAKEAGIDVQKWQTCVDKKEPLAQFEAQTKEAQWFGLGWTPGTLILNVKNGKYMTVEGAYPIDAFNQKIDELMK